jgi:hypothetical protein
MLQRLQTTRPSAVVSNAFRASSSRRAPEADRIETCPNHDTAQQSQNHHVSASPLGILTLARHSQRSVNDQQPPERVERILHAEKKDLATDVKPRDSGNGRHDWPIHKPSNAPDHTKRNRVEHRTDAKSEDE